MTLPFTNCNLVDLPLILGKENIRSYLQKNIEDHLDSISKNNILVIQILWDGGHPGDLCNPPAWKKEFDRFVEKAKTINPQLTIILILNSWFKEFNQTFDNIHEVVYIDFYLFRTYYQIIKKQQSGLVSKWDPSTKKMLLFTGKPSRIQRTRLMYKLIQAGLIDHMIWSYGFANQEQYKIARTYLPELTDEEFDHFAKKYQNFGDGHFFALEGYGTPYNVEVFNNTSFQIISETYFETPAASPWVTEKTWISIINRRPFIVVGEFGHLNKLKKMGFKTFQEFLPVPNYDDPDQPDFLIHGPESNRHGIFLTPTQIDDWHKFYQKFLKTDNWPNLVNFNDIDKLSAVQQQEIASRYSIPIESMTNIRLDAIVENAKFWINNIEKFSVDIEQAVDYNYNRLVELGIENVVRLQSVVDRYKLNCQVDELVHLLIDWRKTQFSKS